MIAICLLYQVKNYVIWDEFSWWWF